MDEGKYGLESGVHDFVLTDLITSIESPGPRTQINTHIQTHTHKYMIMSLGNIKQCRRRGRIKSCPLNVQMNPIL